MPTIDDFVQNLSAAQTKQALIACIGILPLHEAIEAIKEALDEDGKAELAAQLEPDE